MGLFIALEGGDGSGKGTQATLLEEYLKNDPRYDVLRVSFPRYGEPSAIYAGRYLDGVYGDADSVHPDLASLPYAIDRFAAKSQIEEMLAKPGGVVIADRYVASNLAHQGTKLADNDARRTFYDEILRLEFEILGIPKPSRNIVLIMPTDIAQTNVDKKDSATRSYTTKKRDIHEADASHLERAKANFEELCSIWPEQFTAVQCTVNGELKNIEAIHQEIVAILDLPHQSY